MIQISEISKPDIGGNDVLPELLIFRDIIKQTQNKSVIKNYLDFLTKEQI